MGWCNETQIHVSRGESIAFLTEILCICEPESVTIFWKLWGLQSHKYLNACPEVIYFVLKSEVAPHL